MRAGHAPNVWPEAPALRCPACSRVLPLRGIRADLTLLFMCPEHSYFGAATWTSDPSWVDPHVDLPWFTDAPIRRSFMAAALSVFLGSGVEGDYMFLQSPVPDNYLRFTIAPGGDGTLVGEVSSRLPWGCPRCEVQPLNRDSEQALFDMGFDPCVAGERDYRCEHLPFDAEWLSAIAEVAFRRGFAEAEDFGICAIFNQPGDGCGLARGLWVSLKERSNCHEPRSASGRIKRSSSPVGADPMQCRQMDSCGPGHSDVAGTGNSVGDGRKDPPRDAYRRLPPAL